MAIDDSDISYLYNTLKGRMAESLFEEIGKNLDLDISRCGQETKFPELLRSRARVRMSSYTIIRELPDFLWKTRDRDWFVEVRYRKNPYLVKEKISRHYFDDTAYVLFSPSGIFAAFPDEINEHMVNGRYTFNVRWEDHPRFAWTTQQVESIKCMRRLAIHVLGRLPEQKETFKETYVHVHSFTPRMLDTMTKARVAG